jgi:hypothetical protein
MDGIERVEMLRQSADTAAGLVRGVYLTFLLTGTYLLITIGATTDLQLVLGSPVNLPILNVGLPIAGFYALAPWIFVLLHFNLLLQHYLLAERLHRLEMAIRAIGDPVEQLFQRSFVFPLPFSQMLVGSHHSVVVRNILASMVVLSVILLPIMLLLWAQVRYLPAHNLSVTWWQRSAVAVDVLIVTVLWSRAIAPTGKTMDWLRAALTSIASWLILPRLLRGWIQRPGRRPLRVRARWMRARHRRFGQSYGGLTVLAGGPLTLIVAYAIATIPGEPIEDWLTARLPISLTTADLGRDDKWNSPKRAACPRADGRCFVVTYLLFDQNQSWFHRNLRLFGADLVGGDPGRDQIAVLRDSSDPEHAQVMRQVVGLDLSNRE